MTRKKLDSILKERIEKTLQSIKNSISYWEKVFDESTSETEKEAVANDIYKLYAIKTTLENLLDESLWGKSLGKDTMKADIYVYDVWGNAREGYEINDVFKHLDDVPIIEEIINDRKLLRKWLS